MKYKICFKGEYFLLSDVVFIEKTTSYLGGFEVYKFHFDKKPESTNYVEYDICDVSSFEVIS